MSETNSDQAAKADDTEPSSSEASQATVSEGTDWIIKPRKRSDGLSDNMSAVLTRAAELAFVLNHDEVATPHFVLALTLLPGPSEELRRNKYTREGAWREAIKALLQLPPAGPEPSSPKLSRDIQILLERAKTTARDSGEQAATINDVMDMVGQFPEDNAMRRLLSGQPQVSAAEESRDAIRLLEQKLDQRMDALIAFLKPAVEKRRLW